MAGGFCAVCGVVISGRADRSTCSPRCKKARQRESAARSPDPAKTALAIHGVEPSKGDKIAGPDALPSDPALSPLIARFMRDKRLPFNVASAFAKAGVEAPHRDTIDARGFTFAERKIIDREAA